MPRISNTPSINSIGSNVNASEPKPKSFIERLIQKIINLITFGYFFKNKPVNSAPIKRERISRNPSQKTSKKTNRVAKKVANKKQTKPKNPSAKKQVSRKEQASSIKPKSLSDKENIPNIRKFNEEEVLKLLSNEEQTAFRNIQNITNLINNTKDTKTLDRLQKSLMSQIKGLSSPELQKFAVEWSSKAIKEA